MCQDKACVENNDFNSKRTQLWATIAICFFFIGVGIPVWWKTTEVYRAELPYAAVSSLADQKDMQLKTFVKLVNSISDFSMSSFAADLKLQLNSGAENSLVFVSYDVQIIDDVNSDMNSPNNHVVKFMIGEVKNFKIVVSKERTIYCYLSNALPQEDIFLKEMQEELVQLLKNVIVNEKRLAEVISSSYGKTLQPANDNFLKKAVKTSPNFELLFSLLCPEPEKIIADWDIQDAVAIYMDPLLNKLKPVFDFHVGSQVLYYTKISYAPKAVKKNNTVSFYYITPDQLSLVINPIEAKLGSQLSSNPTLNFAVYVTEKRRTPLYIKTGRDSYSKSNSFLVPRWGSMMFYNVEEAQNDRGVSYHKIDMKKVFGSFLEHFRTLVGVPIFSDYSSMHSNVEFEFPKSVGLTDWELDTLMRLRAVENSASSVHTLNSLTKLLSQISNIVIKDEIASDVYTAVNAIEMSKAAAQVGNLSEFLEHSKKAFAASETAFFDPTLLELLYFPEDQKFAIYVPLFLPISLPIVMSILKLLKRYKQRSKEKSD